MLDHARGVEMEDVVHGRFEHQNILARVGQLARGKRGGVVFIKGQEPIRVEENLAEELIKVARKIAAEKTAN